MRLDIQILTILSNNRLPISEIKKILKKQPKYFRFKMKLRNNTLTMVLNSLLLKQLVNMSLSRKNKSLYFLTDKGKQVLQSQRSFKEGIDD